MARMLTAADVQAAAAAGQPLRLAPGERLTPLARDRARELGVAVVDGVAQAAPAATRSAPPTPGPSAAGSTGTSTGGAPVAAPAGPAGPGSSAASTAPAMPTAPAAPASTSASAPHAGPAPGAARGPAPDAGPGVPLVLPPSGAMYRRRALGPADPRAPGRDARPVAGVVGAGHVGAMVALRLAQSDLFAEVRMVDVVPGLAAGLALDLWHGAGLYGFSTRLAGSTELATLAGARYIVITAGKPRQPGMSRTDLTAVNADIMRTVASAIGQHAPDATLVVVSNPLEEMTHLAAELTGFPDERVLGMAGVLDAARFCALAGLAGRCAPQQVRALALGSHGPEMVIPLSAASIDGQPIERVLDATTLTAVVERTRDSGAEVVKLLQTGSAYFAPAESAAAMVRAMVRPGGEVLAACVRSRGALGTVDTRVGLPVRLGPHGLQEIVALALRADEAQALHEASARIAARIAALAALGAPLVGQGAASTPAPASVSAPTPVPAPSPASAPAATALATA